MCAYVCMHACMYTCLYVCMYVCMHVYTCITYIYIYIYIYIIYIYIWWGSAPTYTSNNFLQLTATQADPPVFQRTGSCLVP